MKTLLGLVLMFVPFPENLRHGWTLAGACTGVILWIVIETVSIPRLRILYFDTDSETMVGNTVVFERKRLAEEEMVGTETKLRTTGGWYLTEVSPVRHVDSLSDHRYSSVGRHRFTSVTWSSPPPGWCGLAS